MLEWNEKRKMGQTKYRKEKEYLSVPNWAVFHLQ